MFSWRVRRQIVALLIVTFPVAVLVFWFLPKLLPELTCFDNQKNQSELDVDCGGPCAPCELRNPDPIAVFWARVVPVRKNAFDVVALVENRNEVLSSVQVEYEFSLFDPLGLVERRIGHTFILPQERAFIIETNLRTTRSPERVEFRIVKVDWQFKQGERPNFAVESKDYKIVEENGAKQSVVEAIIVNRSSFDFKKIALDFVVFDNLGNIIGVSTAILENFSSGSRRSVKAFWPQELSGPTATIEVAPRINIFEEGMILKPQ